MPQFFSSRIATRAVAVCASATMLLLASPVSAQVLPAIPAPTIPSIASPLLSVTSCTQLHQISIPAAFAGQWQEAFTRLCGQNGGSSSSSSSTSSSSGGSSSSSGGPGGSSSSSSSVNMGNLILNGDMELDSGNGVPQNWHMGSFGTNNATFRYPVDGFPGKGAEVFMTQWTDGDAKWYFDDVAVTPGVMYQFSNRYKSNVTTHVNVRYDMGNGNFQYADVGSPAPSTDWAQFTAQIVPPAGTVSLTVFHILAGINSNGTAGTLTVDSYDLRRSVTSSSSSSSSSTSSSSTSSSSSSSSSTSGGSSSSSMAFDKGYVTLDFDDGWTSHHRNVMPILNAAGFKGTFYVVSNEAQMAEEQDYNKVGHYLTINKLKELQNAGHEVTAHSQTHASLVTLSENQMKAEIGGSRTALLNQGFTPVDTFAYPFGDKNATVMQVVKDSGFIGARGVNGGYNTKTTNKYDLEVQNVLDGTTAAQMKAWIDQAVQNKTWLNLVFHEVDAAANAPGVEDYSTTPAILQDVVNYLKNNNIAVITTHQGLQMMP